ncbi:hypothetical protein HQ520_04295, partial [bacterium]|nr:hypothetical protein [bacterium]
HWTLGVHPSLGKVTDEDLHRLQEICPANAISTTDRRIIREKCITVRCLKCYREGPRGAVRLKGLRPPQLEEEERS